jgi:hypothetical protein
MSLVFIPEETLVILIGCGNFLEDSSLKPIKPIEANLARLKGIFRDTKTFNGIPEENITVIQNEKDYEILKKVEELSQLASDALVVYYAGHGEREKGRTLYLTATNTRKDRLISTAIEFERLNKIIQAAKATKKFLILDCCYSGLAALSTDNESLLEEELSDITGTYIITSSPSNMVSYFHENEEHTFFTSELINLLTSGLDNNAPFIEIGEIFEYIKSNLRRKNYPLPMQKNTLNASGKVYFANNHRYLDYSRKVNGADDLLRADEFNSAFEAYKKIITEFSSYNNESIELKMKAIELTKNSEILFEQNKYEVANKNLSSALEMLESIEFNIGRILRERKKVYSSTALMESELREELKEYLTPLIRKDLEEEFTRQPDLLEQALREKLEQEYRVKAIGLERELREKISREHQDAVQGKLDVKRSLVLSANPLDTTRLRIDQEIRELHSIFKYSNNYQLLISLATKANEIDQIILESTPEILHLTVHANAALDPDGRNIADFYFEDDQGKGVPINGKRLAEFLKIFPSIKLVFINTCYSDEVAYRLSEFIPYAIGFEDAIADTVCIAFAKSFYIALLSQQDIEFAYNFAITACSLKYNRDSKPRLHKQENFVKKKASREARTTTVSSVNYGDVAHER